MAKRSTKSTTRKAAQMKPTKRPHSRALPGMEDRAIKPLEEVAEQYAAIRDERMELTQREHALKDLALKLMKKFEKTVYRHDGIEITVVPGEDDVKVRVKKEPEADEEDASGPRADEGEFAEERRAALADSGE